VTLLLLKISEKEKIAGSNGLWLKRNDNFFKKEVISKNWKLSIRGAYQLILV